MADQLGLFGPRPAHRPLPPHNGSDTSIAGARAIAPRAGTLRAAVLAFVAKHGMHGATHEEIADALGLKMANVCGRMGELKAAGLVRDAGERRAGGSGVKAKVWIASGRTA